MSSHTYSGTMYVTIAESVVRAALGAADPPVVAEVARALADHSRISSELSEAAAQGLVSAAEVGERSARVHADTEREIHRILHRANAIAPQSAPVPRARPAEEEYRPRFDAIESSGATSQEQWASSGDGSRQAQPVNGDHRSRIPVARGNGRPSVRSSTTGAACDEEAAVQPSEKTARENGALSDEQANDRSTAAGRSTNELRSADEEAAARMLGVHP